MKNPDREIVSKLDELPNIGKSISKELKSIGIQKPTDLIGKNPFQLYEKLCSTTNTKHDPCIIDVFMSAVDFMEGGKAKPWWYFTKQRKEVLKEERLG